MLDKCLSSSLEIGQCKNSLNAKAQVSALRSLLVSEYRVGCRKIYLSAPGMPGMRVDDYVYEDYYYFGDEVLRTKPPKKRANEFGKALLRKEPQIAPSARSKLRDEIRKIFNKIRGMGFDKILSKVKPDFGHAVVEEMTAAVPISTTNSSEEYPLHFLITGAVIPVMDADDATCDIAGYQEERERCTQYIADQADKYRMNIKYIPVSNLRDITDTVCRMVDLYRACMSEVAKRNKCLAMLANTPRIVENQLMKLGLTFCSSATIDSGCSSRHSAVQVTVAILSVFCLKMKNWE
ncbi:hypothetical protein V5799_020809 [Amblyomma americanum]|uniref:Uncharacterized protein n=1 Tax=Amblyomma americanum TaxID=6943 RepID=A0AAQ4ESU5_AMBAM